MRRIGRRLFCAGIATGAVTGGYAFALSPPSFMIFFASGESEISQQGEHTINQFVTSFFRIGRGRVTITGYTDTAEASVPLSMSRAVAAKMRLLEMGIPPDRISIVARGDKGLLVQTPLGTREPQNRRVEFVIQ